jgi:hypothetical protein
MHNGELVTMIDNIANSRVGLFDLWLALHPISEEFRGSLLVSAASLAQAYDDRFKDDINVSPTDQTLLNERFD